MYVYIHGMEFEILWAVYYLNSAQCLFYESFCFMHMYNHNMQFEIL
jgi:hypothetical protein